MLLLLTIIIIVSPVNGPALQLGIIWYIIVIINIYYLILVVDEAHDLYLWKLKFWKDTHNGQDYECRNKLEDEQFENINVNQINQFYRTNLQYCGSNLNGNYKNFWNYNI